MRFVHTATAALILLCFVYASPLFARAVVSSGFDANSEGWTAVTADIATAGIPLQTSSAVTHHTTGGNPNGYVSFLDPDAFDGFFRAPASFLGNQTAALGGTLNYDTITDLSVDYSGADVVLKGAGGGVLVCDIAPPASAAWSTVSVTLAPSSNWHVNTLTGPAASLADFQTALANVSELWITAEYHAGVSETTGVDNVALTAVPEPAGIATALECAGGVGIALAGRGLRGRRFWSTFRHSWRGRDAQVSDGFDLDN